MDKFLLWYANSKVASYLRAFVAIVLFQAITEFQRSGAVDIANWQHWIVAGLVSFLPVLSRAGNPADSL